MARGDRPRRACLQVARGKYFADGKPFAGEVVVAQSVGLVAVIQQDEPPASVGRLIAFRDDSELSERPPDRTEIIGHLLLERSHDRRDILVGQNGALVDHRNLDGLSLWVGGLRHTDGLLWK